MKNHMFLLILIIVFSVCVCGTMAETMADTVFSNASTSLSSTKNAVFSAYTVNVMNSIKVTRVRLYRKNADNSWSYVRDLPAPTDEATNDQYFGASKDYSAYIGAGTYRLYTTFTADGHSMSRYSNTRTYTD